MLEFLAKLEGRIAPLGRIRFAAAEICARAATKLHSPEINVCGSEINVKCERIRVFLATH